MVVVITVGAKSRADRFSRSLPWRGRDAGLGNGVAATVMCGGVQRCGKLLIRIDFRRVHKEEEEEERVHLASLVRVILPRTAIHV